MKVTLLVVGKTTDSHIEALINGEYLITLYPTNKYVSDTMVFEGDLPEALKDKKITSIKNIEQTL
jgi:hypothetical protein